MFHSLQSESDGETQTKRRPPSPPNNRNEWLQHNDYKQWPIEEEEDESFEMLKPDDVLGDLDDIRQDLRDHAGWDNSFLNDVDKRLHVLEDLLLQSSKSFMSDLCSTGSNTGRLGLRMVNIESSDRFCNSDIIKTLRKNDESDHKTTSVEGGRIVEDAIFPGFPGGAAPLLPGNVDALPLLDLVTKLLNTDSSFLKFWRKIAFSDESVAFLQLLFWWLWMEKYKPNVDQQSELVTKMAGNFTELVLKLKGKKRDDFFLKYPYCLCQALYSTFCQAFSRSIQQFHCKKFLQWLCTNVYELITGLPSPVECWNEWQMNQLDPFYEERISKDTKPTNTNKTGSTPSGSLNTKTLLFSRQSNMLDKSVRTNKLKCQDQEDTLITVNDESPRIGPGPVFESVKFGTVCCSPLMQHQLWTHGLVDSSQMKESRKHNLMTRTQIKELAPPSMTYSELMSNVTNTSQQRYKDYAKEVAGYEQEIQKGITEYYASKREIQKFVDTQETKKLLKYRHEISIEAEKIMASYNSQSVPLKEIHLEEIKHKDKRNN